MRALPFAAGLDGGGSKTALCCMDGAGNILDEGSFGPLNINAMDLQAIGQTLKDVAARLKALEQEGRALKGITIATAGISNSQCRDILQTGLTDAGCDSPFDLKGDQEAALRGAVGKVGAVLIAGTGAICYGQNQKGAQARAGGWGYLLDDEGGGYSLGRDILRAVLRMEDGRGQPTRLKDLVYAQPGVQAAGGIIPYAYDPVEGKAHIACLSRLLPPALQMGDQAALAIARRAAEELFAQARAVITKLGLDTQQLALAGSVLTLVAPIREDVAARLKAAFLQLSIIKPKKDAAWGAADMARETFLC